MLVHQSSTRRKSCVACIRAKRRCDLILPRCTRCAGRGWNCEYTTPSTAVDEKRRTAGRQAGRHRSTIHDSQNATPSSAASPGIGSEDCSTETNDPSPFDSLPVDVLVAVPPEQIRFCINQFASSVSKLVRHNRSPFIHPSSYRDAPPSVYQDLLGVSAMYSQKTPQNQSIVFSMLDDHTARLVKPGNSSGWSIEDYLVGTQALIVYQIIRLLDGDVRQRASAERQFSTLQTWTSKLRFGANIYHNDAGSAKSLFERWVFIESARRTILMSLMLQAMYSCLKVGVCSLVPLMSSLPMSSNAELWGMSEDDWWQATLGLGGRLLTYQEFLDQWNGGAPFHLDDYETILVVACRHNTRRTLLTY